jgi:hypothetical protein
MMTRTRIHDLHLQVELPAGLKVRIAELEGELGDAE